MIKIFLILVSLSTPLLITTIMLMLNWRAKISESIILIIIITFIVAFIVFWRYTGKYIWHFIIYFIFTNILLIYSITSLILIITHNLHVELLLIIILVYNTYLLAFFYEKNISNIPINWYSSLKSIKSEFNEFLVFFIRKKWSNFKIKQDVSQSNVSELNLFFLSIYTYLKTWAYPWINRKNNVNNSDDRKI